MAEQHHTYEVIRQCGGIVHSDGNIFFTNRYQFEHAASILLGTATVKVEPSTTRPSSVEGGDADTCKLTECQGKPRCEKCLTMDRAYGVPASAPTQWCPECRSAGVVGIEQDECPTCNGTGKVAVGVKACGSHQCIAAQRDGVLCADGECDRENGVRPDGVAVVQPEQDTRKPWERTDWNCALARVDHEGLHCPDTGRCADCPNGVAVPRLPQQWEALIEEAVDAFAEGATLGDRLPNAMAELRDALASGVEGKTNG